MKTTSMLSNNRTIFLPACNATPFSIPVPSNFGFQSVSRQKKNNIDHSSTTNPNPNHKLQYAMAELPAIDFNTGESSGRVSIGSHRLFLRTAGPDRKPNEPVVIIIQGLATSTKGWAAVYRLLKPFVRVYLYDRAGYGQSDASPEKPSSTNIAKELDLLLRNAMIAPPFVLLCHSWGGVLSREFFSLRPDDVVGMVFVDANQEHTLEVLDWREPAFSAIAGAVEFFEGSGVSRKHRLTAEEWEAYVDDEASAKHKDQAMVEHVEYGKSFPVLGSKLQLHRSPPFMGARPLSVVVANGGQDFVRLYAAGVKEGAGSEQERAVYLEYLVKADETNHELQKEILSLSSNSRLVSASESGHNVQVTQPGVIVEEVKWVLEQCRKYPFGSGSMKRCKQ